MAERSEALAAAIAKGEATGQWSEALTLIRTDLVEPLEAALDVVGERDALAEALRRIKRYHPDAPVLVILPIVRAALAKLGEDDG